MRHFTFLLIIFTFLNSYSQENKAIIYQDSDGTLMTETEYYEFKEGFKKKMKEQGKSGGIKEIIRDSIAQNMVYKKFQLSFISKSDITIKERIDTYLYKKFPAHKFTTLESEEITLRELEGKPTFITFWFTHCAPCIKEIPALETLKNKYGNKVNFLAITFNEKEKVKSFLEKREFDYKHIVNAMDFINEIGLNTYPRNIILDKNGIIKMINNEVPYKKKVRNNIEILEFDLSAYEKELENLL